MQGIRIDFDNVCMSVQLSKKKGSAVVPRKHILRNISGHVLPGRFTAVMGPSGSGKTTLLNVLAARTTRSKGLVLTASSLRVDGKEVVDWDAYRQQVAYVEQDDLMFHTLSVRETLELAAQLRMPHELSYQAKMAKVDEVIQILGLGKCEDTRIGNASAKGVSGGERKRTSIGLAILRSPTVLFLDECTSGLDSFAAMRVVVTLKDFAVRGGCTVVTSIHQPRSSIFSQFDDLILVSEGRMMYFGRAAAATAFLEDRLGLVVPENFNPGDFLMDMVSVDMRTEKLERTSRARVERIASAAVDVFNEQAAAKRKGSSVGVQQEQEDEQPQKRAKRRRRYEASMALQFFLLGKRAFVQKTRDRESFVPHMGTSILFGVIMGLVYLQNGNNLSQNAIQDKAGLLYFICMNQSMSGMMIQTQTFPVEKDIVQRERSCNSYSVAPYYFSKTLSDLPNLLFPFTFCTITYWMAALPSDAAIFFQVIVLTLLLYICASSFGLACSAVSSSPENAMALAQPWSLIFVLFSGFYANTELIPVWLGWIQYVSYMRWGFVGMVNVVMKDMVFTCTEADMGCIATGQDYINRAGMGNDSFGKSCGIMIGIAAVFQIIGCTLLAFKKVRWNELEKSKEEQAPLPLPQQEEVEKAVVQV